MKETWPPESLTVIHENCGAKLQLKSKIIDKDLINIFPR